MTSRFVQKFLLCVCLMLAGGAGQAQISSQAVKPTAASLPSWIVLVLKPIGADRVRPVTGVIVSEDGLIVVPMDFAAPGDQIIVLDGGTDIIANGRAATIRKQLPDAGLTLLSAAALKRRPASLSAAPLADGEDIRLAAFPPAELIAQGAAPVSVSSQVALKTDTASTGGNVRVTTGIFAVKALPNVSGPLLDSCGNLVGFSSAEGVQSMDTTRTPGYLWKDDLARALQNQGIILMEAACPPAVSAAETELAVNATGAQASEPEENAAKGAVDTAWPGTTAGAQAAGRARKVPSAVMRASWLRRLGLVTVVLLAVLLWWARRRRAAAAGGPGPQAHERPAKPARQPSPSSEKVMEPDDDSKQSDCVVDISGHLPDGTPFRGSCDASSAAINLLIGRGRADIVIDSQDVHREHARLSGSADMLTITDLGSTRGTWINRVPCLKGEIMFIGAEDTIFLGNVSFQITVRSAIRSTADTS